MGFGDVTQKSITGGGFGSVATAGEASPEEQLLAKAQTKGYEPKEKVGTLTRLFNVLSAFEPGGEIATGIKTGDWGKAGKQYISEVGRGLGSAIPALDPHTKPKELSAEREGFSAALEAAGWRPETKAGKIARGAAGIAGDIVLDPGNLALAPLFKLLGKGVKGVGKAGVTALAKSEKGQDVLRGGLKVKEGLGEAFIHGYKVKKEAPELVDFVKKFTREANIGDDEAVKIVQDLVKKHGLESVQKAAGEIEAGGKVLKGVDTIEVLRIKARKYKSADEFVSSQKPFFRATDKKFNTKLLTDDGLFVSPKRSVAERYLEKGKIIDELYIKPNAKILTFENTPKKFYKMDEGFAIPRDNGDGIEIAKYAKSKGFDVVEYGVDPQGLVPESAIVSKDIVVTKSLLTDIYNQAKGVDSLAQEVGKKLSPAAQEISDMYKKLGLKQVRAGLLTEKQLLPDYFSRTTIKEPLGMTPGGVPKIKPGIKGYAERRLYPTRKMGEAAGFEYLAPPEELAKYVATAERGVKSKSAINQLIAGEVKDLAGNPIIKKAGEEGAEGLKHFSKIKELSGYTAHPDVVDYLEKAQSVFVNDETSRNVFKMWDKVQNLWKGSVTTYFPAFHTRNALGNVFNNFVAGVKQPLSYADAAKIQKGTGKLDSTFKGLFPGAETYDDLRKILGEMGVTGQGQFGKDVPKVFKQAIGKGSLGQKAQKIGFGVGTSVEDNARIAHFLEKTRGGLGINDAAASVNKFLFDYTDLSSFEQNVLKRIFPFYTFTRKNIPLQLEQIFKQPKKYKAVSDALQGLKSGDLTAEEKRYLPDYLSERFGIMVGRDVEGMPKILSGLGLPLEDIEKITSPAKTVFGEMASPLIKAPFELLSGQSLFTEGPIADTSMYNATTKAIGSLPGFKQFLKAKAATNKAGQTYYRVDPERMYILKALIGRFVGSFETLTDKRKGLPEALLRTLGGLKIYTADITKSKERKLLEMLEEMGLTREYKIQYVPKEKKEELGL